MGAGGAAVFSEFSRGEGTFLPGAAEAVLGEFGEAVGLFPERGAGADLAEVGLEVVVVFLVDGGATVLPEGANVEVFLG